MATERSVSLGAELPFAPGVLRRRPLPLSVILGGATHCGVCVDVGCGDAAPRSAVEKMGWEYVGLDPFSHSADLAAAAEALPLRCRAADVVYSNAVLEHVDGIAAAVAEISRVLRDDGRLVAYVAFLEPYHELSQLHASHIAVEKLCREAGLDLIALSPGENALSFTLRSMLFPRGAGAVATVTTKLLVAPAVAWTGLPGILGAVKRWKRPRQAVAHVRQRQWLARLTYASGFHFVARKVPAEA